MNNYSFGNYLRDLREKNNLSQAQLGVRLGVTNKSVSKWETGTAYPSTEMMLPLAKALGVTIEELYNAVSQAKAGKSFLRKILDIIYRYPKIEWLVLVGLAVLSYIIFLIFGDAEMKKTLSYIAPIEGITMYVFVRLMFYGLFFKSPMHSKLFIDIMEMFFTVGVISGCVSMIVMFANDIKTGYSATCFACLMMLAAIAR